MSFLDNIIPQPKQLMFLQSLCKIVFFGGGAGGGKTWSALLDNLQGVHDPDYLSVFFRSSLTEIDKDLWPKALKFYESILKDSNGRFIGKANINKQMKEITWPSGARTVFSYLQADSHADQWYGVEITKIYFEEFQFRTEYQFDILYSRNRSMANVTKGIRCTLNPDPDHFVYEWIKPFLDDEGFPILEFAGRTRFFFRKNGELFTAWTKEEIEERFGFVDNDPNDRKILTYTYIPATLEDNSELLKADPEYKAVLDAMPEKKRKRLLLGCWAPDEDSGLYFKRSWITEIESKDQPKDIIWVRAYDLGYSEPTPDYPKPDYTACVLVGKDRKGNVYVRGDYIDSFKDRDTEILGQIRRSPGERDRLMLEQAKSDTKKVYVGLPREGAGGKENYQHKVKMFSQEGFIVKQDPMNSNANKLTKFEPFSSYCETPGLVSFVTDSFPKSTLEHLYAHLERFDPNKRSNTSRKDDLADAIATGFNILMTMRNVPIVARNQSMHLTVSHDYLKNH